MNQPVHSMVVGNGRRNVVFLHGVFGQGKNFTEVAKELSDLATCRLIDLPNHGRSAWTEEFSLDGMVDAVTSHLIDNGALETPITLIGHSLGGKVAMRLALNYPRLIERLIVVDISPVPGNTASVFAPWIRAMLDLDLDHLDSRRQADELLHDAIPDRRIRTFLLTNLHREDATWSWRPNLPLILDNLDTVSGWPAIDRPPYPGPVLWMRGGESTYVQDEYLPAMKAFFPKVELVTVDHASHWVHADRPGVFVELVREFLTRPLPR